MAREAVILYAESSALLAWFLKEPAGGRVRELLRSAEMVVSSVITPAECQRAVRRALAAERLTPEAAEEAHAAVVRAAATWVLQKVNNKVLALAAGAFPAEPVRTLDAIHLASARLFQRRMAAIVLLTLDERIRRNAEALGIPLAP